MNKEPIFYPNPLIHSITVLPNERKGVVKVRMTRILGEYPSGGKIIEKYGLSFITGKWVQVAEGANYPPECIGVLSDMTIDGPTEDRGIDDLVTFLADFS